MYVNVKNENYGYSVATFGDFVAVGNPGLLRYNLLSGSIASWHLDEAMGYRYDTLGRFPLTASGAPTQKPGKVNYALGVTPTSGLTHPNSTFLTVGNNNFTFTGWVWLDALPAADAFIISKHGATYREYAIGINSAGKVFLDGYGNSSYPRITSSIALSTGTWYNFIAWRDKTSNILGISVNGAEALQSYTASWTTVSGNFRLGVVSGANGINGRIDEVSLYKRLLTSSERHEWSAFSTWSGSVDVFKYNYNTDEHDYVSSLYADNVLQEILLAAETGSPAPPITGSLVSGSLRTEVSGSDETSRNKDLQIDKKLYTTMLEDGYGLSIDIYNKLLVIGCPYYEQQVTTLAGFSSVTTGSSVDIYNLKKYEQDAVNSVLVDSRMGNINVPYFVASGSYKIYINDTPAGYDLAEVLFSTTVTGPFDQVIARKAAPKNGGYIEFIFSPSMLPYPSGFFLFRFSITDSSYVTSLINPHNTISESFGRAVSINSGWVAVGSPYVSGSGGAVYIYKNDSYGNELSWSFQQRIEPGNAAPGLLFGSALELNKVTGSRSGSLIVGVGHPSGSQAYLFEYLTGSWTNTYTFTPGNVSRPLTFGNYTPYSESFVRTSSYGSAVSIYNNTVVVGSPQDRKVKEYNLSEWYNQGAVYVYELCIGTSPTTYELVLKTHGDETILKNNKLGYSVGIYGNNIIAGSPREEVTISPCEIQGTIGQLHYCPGTLTRTLNGQALFLQRNTSSFDWEISKVYQRKKRYLSPYRCFGYSVDIADKSMVIGAPMVLSTMDREVNIPTTESIALDDLAGKAYIYNLHNFHPSFHLGNVFYRNGKLLLMTSGSIFDKLFYNPVSQNNYEYELDFKGEHTIFEKQIICSVDPGEFNTSTNPTAITREKSIFDINGNGYVDFQDIDVLLRYMQYKNTLYYGNTGVSINWSSSIVTAEDERSLLAYYQENYDSSHTEILTSESINRFEFTDTWMQAELDFNQDNRIDTRDLNILWKYFTNRLTQDNYITYITPASNRKLFSDIMDHMADVTKKNSVPLIRSGFADYDRLSATDKTGSYLAPFATTIGLYSGLDLIAVAKLGNPVKIIPDLPINFAIKIDF